ncbi:hypothetical protein HYH03_013816 [Edaphochlamys debaryana]|uniref:Uncharacterized protein n=1 Tax=Edaphochlamys debaryana TaxID=47281 RepID=A0A835XSQ5_9CHLO|nr:hypothetical protein HYH03_013816 [Edaphochlamys debaryana]|eukprot:KAG2487536.1 hypothetical protein HYH03_013816 [Edaphochlamys debaryana]
MECGWSGRAGSCLGGTGDAFLRAFATAPPTPLPTRQFDVGLAALSSEAAGLVAAAFKQLDSLWLAQPLFNPSPVQATWAPLLPAFLETLIRGREHPLTSLTVLGSLPLSLELCSVLSSATQLTQLSAWFRLTEPDHASAIANLTSLKSLSITTCTPQLLPALLSPLTALTSLSLSLYSTRLPTGRVSALSGLVSLRAGKATLDVRTLTQLTSLTTLAISGLVLPPTSGIAELAGSYPSSYLLPPNLGEVEAACAAPEALHALRASPVRQLTWQIGVVMDRGQHFDNDTGALTELGEAGLCDAAAFLAGRMDAGSDVWIGTENSTVLLPVGGEVGAGPARRNHTAWLEALGRAGVPRLTLDHVSLSHHDLTTLSAHTGLKRLDLSDGTQYPTRGLLVLPRAPALELLTLDVTEWCGPDREGPFEPPPDLPGMLQALLFTHPQLRIELCCRETVGVLMMDQVHELASELAEELGHMGDPRPNRLAVDLHREDD